MNKAWKFVGGMSLEGFDRLCGDFTIDASSLKDTAGVCWSSEPDYEESMRAIYRDAAGQYFEVNDSHCSCNGWGPWDPKPVTPEYVQHLVENANDHAWSALGCPDFINALKTLVGAKEAA